MCCASECICSFVNKAPHDYIPKCPASARLIWRKQQALEALCEMEKLQKQLIILKEIQQLSFEIDRVQRLKAEGREIDQSRGEAVQCVPSPSVSTCPNLQMFLFIFLSINWYIASLFCNRFCTHVVYQVATTWRPNLWKSPSGWTARRSVYV